MRKVIVIGSCIECPHYQDMPYEKFCGRKMIDHYNGDEIPEWCPLENEKPL